MQLPELFIRYTRETMGEELFQRYLESFQQDTPVSIRLNPKKLNLSGGTRLYTETETEQTATTGMAIKGAEPVPWCRHAYYLPQRPNFTMDPLLHAGCYYVQEAASMFLDEVLRQHLSTIGSPLSALDLCAAPGGKSTLLRAVLPDDCTLYSNEPIRNRASILLENVAKWGHHNHIVTNNYPRDYRKSKMHFDIVLCDVPCSGEGMFRKDEATIREWSPQNVERCWQLQREIVSDAWACLNPGGLLIYSTCTFNTKENEENIRWIAEETDAEILPVETSPEWHITGSLLPDFTAPVYRFIPGISRGEGLFMCVLRKKGGYQSTPVSKKASQTALNVLSSPLSLQQTESKKTIEATIDLSFAQAIAYLRGEAMVLPADTPCGPVTVSFMGHPLGLVKNIGTRANNLYPKEWRIRTTHIPNEYKPILSQT